MQASIKNIWAIHNLYKFVHYLDEKSVQPHGSFSVASTSPGNKITTWHEKTAGGTLAHIFTEMAVVVISSSGDDIDSHSFSRRGSHKSIQCDVMPTVILQRPKYNDSDDKQGRQVYVRLEATAVYICEGDWGLTLTDLGIKNRTWLKREGKWISHIAGLNLKAKN